MAKHNIKIKAFLLKSFMTDIFDGKQKFKRAAKNFS
jgi:hypothetical protein